MMICDDKIFLNEVLLNIKIYEFLVYYLVLFCLYGKDLDNFFFKYIEKRRKGELLEFVIRILNILLR